MAMPVLHFFGEARVHTSLKNVNALFFAYT